MQEKINIPQVVYADEDIVFLAKPAGWVVNQADSVSSPTIQAWMTNWLTEHEANAEQPTRQHWQGQVPADFDDQYGSPDEIFAQRQGMVHRLDKDTSGVLVWARHPGALVHLLAQFRLRQVQKRYLCLVHGAFQIEEDTIRLPIGRSRANRQLFQTDASGRPAETQYRVAEFFPHLDVAAVTRYLKENSISYQGNFKKRAQIYQGFSLLECWPKTGRTHQIRVHCQALQHPLVGDTAYLGRKRAQLDQLWCPRQFLHAAELRLTHPATGQPVEVELPLSTDLDQVLSFLQPSN